MDWLVASEFRWTIPDILETDHKYPGLLDDVNLELWQRGLMKEEVNGSKQS